jgi:hypothetical protein
MRVTLRRALLLPAYYLLFSFLVLGVWEWLQTPFFVDISTDINRIVWFRLHCTLVDILILTGCVAAVCVVRRRVDWLLGPRWPELLAVSVLGVLYTALSEYLNVHLRRSWGYSAWMPLLPWLRIGLVPLVQWLLLPPAVLLLVRDHLKGVIKHEPK